MQNDFLQRCQALAERVQPEGFKAHRAAAAVFRQLTSNNNVAHKWTAIVNALKRLPDEIHEPILLLAESLPPFGDDESEEEAD